MKPSFFKRYSLPILVVSAAMFGVVGVFSVKALRSNKNEVQDWLPSSYPETLSFNWFQSHFAGEQFILVSWEGCTFDDQRLPLLVRKLVPADPKAEKDARQALFSGALTGPELVARLSGEPAPSDATVQAVVDKGADAAKLDAAKSDANAVAEANNDAADDRKNKLTPEEVIERFRGSIIAEQGNLTCAVLTLSKLGEDKPRNAVNAVRDVAIKECAIPKADLHMGGPPVDNAAIDEAGEKSLMKLAAIAGCIGLIVSWWCLRSFRLIAIVFLSGIFGAGLSLAIVAWSGTNMNAILLTMPALVYVAAVSGAIHLSNYYRDTIAEEGLEGAAGRAVRHAALPIGLATGTTAIGLFSLCYSELVPIQQFGLYSAIGVIASVLILVLTVPAAFEMWPLRNIPRNPPHDENLHDDFHVAGLDMSSRWWIGPRMVVKHWGVSCLAVAALLIFCGFGLPRIQTSVQLMRMFPDDSPLKKDYTWLETHLGRLVPMEVVVKIAPEDQEKSPLNFLERLELVQRLQKRVEAIPDVGRALSAVTFAPPLPNADKVAAASEDHEKLLATAPRVIEKHPFDVRQRVWDKRLRKSRPEFLTSGFLAEEKDDGTELWRVSARVWALKDIDYGVFTQELKNEVEKEIGDPEYQKKFGVEVVYTGLVPLVYKAQQSLLDGLLFGFGMDLVVVTIVMMICVREWSAGLILAVPSLLPVVVVFGIMGWLGVVIDPGTVMAPAVALGVTIDDVVHFMIMYRGALKRGLSRQQALMLCYKGCARAIYQSWGVIGVGLSSFAFSPFTPTKRFGIMMIALLSAALIGTLIALPAILASPLGKLFGRRFQRRTEKLQAELAASAELEPVTVGATSPHKLRRDEPTRSQVRRL